MDMSSVRASIVPFLIKVTMMKICTNIHDDKEMSKIPNMVREGWRSTCGFIQLSLTLIPFYAPFA